MSTTNNAINNKELNINNIFVKMITTLSLILLMIMLLNSTSLICKPVVSISILNIILIYIYPNQHRVTKLISFIYFLILLIFLNGDLIRFSFIPQAKVLLDSNPNIIFWFKNGHPHAIRLLVAYPGYILSKVFNIDLNLGFSYYGITMFNLIYLVIMDSVNKLKNNSNKYLMVLLNFVCIIPLIILAFLMNGRLIFAYLGFLIIIEIFISIYKRGLKMNISYMILLVIAFILSTVSSGTLMVSLIYIISMLYVYYYKISRNPPSKIILFFLVIILSPIIYMVFKYAVFMLFRNINYFGGGFNGAIKMLNHGIGRFFILSRFQTILFMVIFIMFLYMNYLYIKKQIQKRCEILPLVLGINISLYGLLFGFSTGLMGLPPLIVLVLYLIR